MNRQIQDKLTLIVLWLARLEFSLDSVESYFRYFVKKASTKRHMFRHSLPRYMNRRQIISGNYPIIDKHSLSISVLMLAKHYSIIRINDVAHSSSCCVSIIFSRDITHSNKHDHV